MAGIAVWVSGGSECQVPITLANSAVTAPLPVSGANRFSRGPHRRQKGLLADLAVGEALAFARLRTNDFGACQVVVNTALLAAKNRQDIDEGNTTAKEWNEIYRGQREVTQKNDLGQ